MTSKEIQKYNKYSLPKLLELAQKRFNAFIRERDKEYNYGRCISCGAIGNQAGHYFSVGHHQQLRFHEDNCHIQDTKCNMYLSGNLINYREGLIKKIGVERVENLEMLAKVPGFKWDRFSVISVILKYKS